MYRHERIRAAYEARKSVLKGTVENQLGILRKLGPTEAQAVTQSVDKHEGNGGARVLPSITKGRVNLPPFVMCWNRRSRHMICGSSYAIFEKFGAGVAWRKLVLKTGTWNNAQFFFRRWQKDRRWG